MVIQIAGAIIALAAVVLVAYLVPVLIQVRRTAEESERLLRGINEELPDLLREARQTVESVNQVTGDLKQGAAQARVLGEAMGAVGQTIHGVVRNTAGALLVNLNGWVSGARAAFQVIAKEWKSHHQGGHSHGD